MSDTTNTTALPYHVPALLTEAIEALDIKPGGIYIDATFGGGGHSKAILERLGPDGHLYGFDQDIDAFRNAIPDSRFTFVRSNFRYIPNFLRFYGVKKVDGILADLGVSSHHFDEAGRGFSFRSDAPLDMRMNQAGGATAADLINEFSEERIAIMLKVGSDLPRIKEIARAIVAARKKTPILTTGELAEAVKTQINPKSEKKELAQIFQAIRIEVNNELEILSTFLHNASEVIRPGGRLAVITYHSLEDRFVKNVMRSGNISGETEKDLFGNVSTPWKLITRSPIVPTGKPAEIQQPLWQRNQQKINQPQRAKAPGRPRAATPKRMSPWPNN